MFCVKSVIYNNFKIFENTRKCEMKLLFSLSSQAYAVCSQIRPEFKLLSASCLRQISVRKLVRKSRFGTVQLLQERTGGIYSYRYGGRPGYSIM